MIRMTGSVPGGACNTTPTPNPDLDKTGRELRQVYQIPARLSRHLVHWQC